MPLFIRLLKTIESDSWRHPVPALKIVGMHRNFINKKNICLHLRYICVITVSYTHLRAHETRHDLVCRLLLEKKKNKKKRKHVSTRVKRQKKRG
ncbi:hypothetical protein BN3590_03586 [Clostridium sp. C105KSO15]|nr:hypothetical protein BN3590_03586 [Clostridium sp. C105KSO15]